MRHLLALVTVGTAIGAVIAAVGDDPALAGILFRVAAVLAAIWLAWPALERIDRRTFWILAIAAVVILLRPRTLVPIAVVVAVFLRTAQLREPPADR